MFLIVGPTGSGKTLLLKRLQTNISSISKDDVPTTVSTVGTNIMNVMTLKKTEVTVREMGGAMAPIWYKYYKDAHAIMFTVDLSSSVQVSAACVLLFTMLSHQNTQTKPVLIIWNKIDCPNVMSDMEVETLFRLKDLMKTASQTIKVVSTSAATGDGLEDVATWLYNNHKIEEG